MVAELGALGGPQASGSVTSDPTPPCMRFSLGNDFPGFKSPTLWDSMDGTGKHYAKQNKPGGERQIPCDLTFNRNLINKTNKEAKYNQKHSNGEQAYSDQSGVGAEFQGKRVKGL